jgi:hypothetical protein
MTWVKLPQEYADRDELLTAGRDAAWLHTAALVYCAKHLTDGHVPRGAIYGLAMGPDAQELADRLVDVGLWYPTDTGYYVPDYLTWNPSRAQKGELSAARASNGRAGGVASGKTRREAKTKHDASLLASSDEANVKQTTKQTTKQNASVVPDRSKNEASDEASDEARIPYSVSRNQSTIDRQRQTRARADDEQAGPRVRTIHERERAARERERAGTITRTDWHDETWLLFKEQYGKVPPRDLRARWPCYCDTPETWQQIQEGLGYWRACRQWVADGPDYVTRAETWLAERKYLVHPPPYEPEKEQHRVGPAQPGGRAGHRDHPRTSSYVWAGDPDDPYWRENHGLISTGLLGPDPEGREGILGDAANAEFEARRRTADDGLPDLPRRGRAQA